MQDSNKRMLCYQENIPKITKEKYQNLLEKSFKRLIIYCLMKNIFFEKKLSTYLYIELKYKDKYLNHLFPDKNLRSVYNETEEDEITSNIYVELNNLEKQRKERILIYILEIFKEKKLSPFNYFERKQYLKEGKSFPLPLSKQNQEILLKKIEETLLLIKEKKFKLKKEIFDN